MSDMLTQEEIDALMNGSSVSNNDEDTASQSAKDVAESVELSQTEKDIIGEVGNISMSQAATTMSSLLNRQVKITTPRVAQRTLKDILQDSEFPKVVTSIEFKDGLDGNNMLMIDVPDAIIIADLMMGNDGKNVSTTEFTDLELSAVGEAMNQMIGSASTAMATMFNRKIDIFPPQVEVLDQETKPVYADGDDETPVVAISFEMTVEGLINSRIVQLFTESTVREINEIMLSDTAVTLADRVPKQEVEKDEASEISETLSNFEEDTTFESKVEIQKPDFQELSDEGTLEVPRNLDLIMDVPLEFTVVLGKSRRTIKDILSLGSGSVVELDKMTDEPLEILVNGKLVAEGEVVVINESFGVRITNILSKEERLRNLNP